jgi:GWxTD domain-containing protein
MINKRPMIKEAFGLALLMLMAAAQAQSWPLTSEGTIKFTVDGAAFTGQQGNLWQEIYWSLPLKEFLVKEQGGTRSVGYRTIIQLRDSSGKLYIDEDWSSTVPVPSQQELERRDLSLMDVIVASNIPSGDYAIKFMVSDLHGGKIGRLEEQITIPPIDQGKLSLSQLEIASDVYIDTVRNKFSKGKLQVRPHPTREFGLAYNKLYYYFEIYRPVTDTSGQPLRDLTVSYASAMEPVVHVVRQDQLEGRTGQIIQAGGIDLDSVADGTYLLRVQIKDRDGKIMAGTQGGFRVRRKPDESLSLAKDKLEQELQERLKEGGEYFFQIEHIATNRELEDLKKLDESGKKEFLRRFWMSRDPDRSTGENEALINYARHYKMADEKFGEKNRGGMKGSKTDRGRIYIKYGIPNEVENKPVQGQYKPLEIWRYYDGNRFIFIDKTGFGRYQLIYSKNKEERTETNYIKYISPDVISNENIQ